MHNDEAFTGTFVSLLRAEWASTHNGSLVTTQASMLYHVAVGMYMGEELVEEESPSTTEN